jgi:general secretion pathway protein A
LIVSGTGKSVALRILPEKLSRTPDTQVGALAHASANLAYFYRELGDIIGVTLSAYNRWNGFKNLRERWLLHLENTVLRPVIFIDAAQEMPICVLNELCLITSMPFDSKLLRSVILAGATF